MPKVVFERGMNFTYNKKDNCKKPLHGCSPNGQKVIDMYEDRCEETPFPEVMRKDCSFAAADWLTDMTWICTMRSSIDQYVDATKDNDQAAKVYIVEHFIPFPEEMQVASWDRMCYEKSCHCANNWWLMGSYLRLDGPNGVHITNQTELEYGRKFREQQYNFYATGEIPEMTHYTGDKEWYYTDKTSVLEKRKIKDVECTAFDEINLYMDV